MSSMMDTVNFCCFVFIMQVVISVINHKHNCNRDKNVFSQTFNSEIQLSRLPAVNGIEF